MSINRARLKKEKQERNFRAFGEMIRKARQARGEQPESDEEGRGNNGGGINRRHIGDGGERRAWFARELIDW